MPFYQVWATVHHEATCVIEANDQDHAVAIATALSGIVLPSQVESKPALSPLTRGSFVWVGLLWLWLERLVLLKTSHSHRSPTQTSLSSFYNDFITIERTLLTSRGSL